MAETTAVGTNLTGPETGAAWTPAPVPDDQNPAIQDALKVFRITMASAVVFVALATFVFFLARLG